MSFDNDEKPLVSIVSPSYNSERYLLETIESVAAQTYDNVEHIIIDGDSTDNSVDLLRDYEDRYGYEWLSEPDEGMYDAICKGFQKADGSIFAWLNADDIYFPWTIQVVVEWLTCEDIQWISGVPAHLDENGVLRSVATIIPRYRREWLRRGWYHGRGLGFVSQESTFWTAELWDRQGGFPNNIKFAGDFYLWKQFANEASLVTVPTLLAAFRNHEDQLTADLESYYAEVDTVGDIFPRILNKLKIQQLYSAYKHAVDRRAAHLSATKTDHGSCLADHD